MKKFIPLLLIFMILSCKNRNSDSENKSDLFNRPYSDYKNIDALKDYRKISDTAYSKSGFENTHRITQLEKNDKILILFSKVKIVQNESKEIYSLLDTLELNQLKESQKVTIGYCEAANYGMEEIIAIVEKTDRDTIQNIIKAWKANDKKK